jgi:hypothetical protein
MVLGLNECGLTPIPEPSPIEVTSWVDELRNIIVIKIQQTQEDGSKRGCTVRLTKEVALRYSIGEGQFLPEVKPTADPCPNC